IECATIEIGETQEAASDLGVGAMGRANGAAPTAFTLENGVEPRNGRFSRIDAWQVHRYPSLPRQYSTEQEFHYWAVTTVGHLDPFFKQSGRLFLEERGRNLRGPILGSLLSSWISRFERPAANRCCCAIWALHYCLSDVTTRHG